VYKQSDWYSDTLRNQLNPAIRRKRLGFEVFRRVTAAWQRPTAHSPLYREMNSWFKTGSVIPSVILIGFGIQRLSPLLAPKRRSTRTWTSLQIRWGVRGGGASFLAQRPKGFFSRENYVLVERWRICAERGGDDSRDVIVMHLFFNKSLYINFPIFIWMTALKKNEDWTKFQRIKSKKKVSFC
jgi:hypothetical protein